VIRRPPSFRLARECARRLPTASIRALRWLSERGQGYDSENVATLRILVLGGTGFIGPYQVRTAFERGHSVAVFNRGRRPADLPPGVEHLHGDRERLLGSLRGRNWDVIDNPVMLNGWVRSIGSLLQDSVGQYIFISTVSVYADLSRPIDETSPAVTYAGRDPFAETSATFEANMATLYGPLKVVAEQEAERWFPGRTTIVRPGLIVGPEDPTDRFTYWPLRLARGGEVLAPGTPLDPVQVIDVRDLAAWTIGIAEQHATGIYNVAGPSTPIGEMLESMRPLAQLPVSFTFADDDFLLKQGVQPWSDMPAWLPPRGATAGVGRVSIKRALATGLAPRPIGDTARDTLAWFASLPPARRQSPRAGLSPEREASVLRAWHTCRI
jgi:2'-hydroxyisoflavone reductase